MKNIIKSFSCVLLTAVLASCSSANESVTAITSSQEDAKQGYTVSDFTKTADADTVTDLEVNAELNHEYTPSYMLENSTDVILGSIISIDSSDMELNSVVGYTYGTLLVDKTYYGSLETDTVITFAKPGAMMISRSDYEAAQDPELQEKLQSLHTDDNGEIYYNIRVEDDIDIEAGKTYLIYLNKLENKDAYEIIGLQNGLREADVEETAAVSLLDDVSGINILDNNTGEWESLDSYVSSNISQ